MENDIVFAVTKEDLQFEAKEKIERELTDEEIEIVRKGLNWGLLTSIDVIYDTIFLK
ncbi:MAG: hypothetical protein LBK58_15995 [Prevotellaceae bacterium]|jgi:hypothetical protein|nr:hypothetical protein [Prevotellaceae bacterium]